MGHPAIFAVVVLLRSKIFSIADKSRFNNYDDNIPRGAPDVRALLDKDLDEEVRKIQTAMGSDIDVTFDCAGFGKTMSTALNSTRVGGKVCLVGMGHNEMTVPLTPAAAREVDIVGVFRYKDTWPLCIEFMRSGKIDVKPLITHRFGFSQEEVEEAFEVSARGGDAIKVMFNL